jgi:hypothetical protein
VTVQRLALREAIEHVRQRHGRTGQAGVHAASRVGDSVTVSGPVAGTGQVTGSMIWTLTAQVPPGVPAGTLAHAVISTALDLEGFPCTPVAAGVPTVTCTGTTAGNALQGSSVVVVFLPGITAVGAVSSAAPAAPVSVGTASAGAIIVPLVPPLAPQVAPPLAMLPPLSPLPPLPVPPVAVGEAARPGAEAYGVPVVPEAETGLLLAASLAALGGLATLRRRRRTPPQ